MPLFHDDLFCQFLLTDGGLDDIDALRPSYGGNNFGTTGRRLGIHHPASCSIDYLNRPKTILFVTILFIY